MKDFKGSVAVITGGASGLGLALAHAAQARGCKLVIADIREDALAAAAKALAAGGEVLAVKTDVSRADEVEALAAAAVAKFGKVNLLFNNAGVFASSLSWETSADEYDWVIGVNQRSVASGLRWHQAKCSSTLRANSDPGESNALVAVDTMIDSRATTNTIRIGPVRTWAAKRLSIPLVAASGRAMRDAKPSITGNKPKTIYTQPANTQARTATVALRAAKTRCIKSWPGIFPSTPTTKVEVQANQAKP